MTERFAAFLYQHPRLRRAYRLTVMCWMGSAIALVTAPSAAASGLAAAYSWTGLHSSAGVPIGQYFISTVRMVEAIREQGPPLDITDPGSYFPAISSAVGTGATYSGLASVLGFQCALLISMVAITLSILKFALTHQWLAWLVYAVAPVVQSILAVGNELHLVEWSLLACTAFGGYLIYRRGLGLGAGVIAGGFAVLYIVHLVLRTPVDQVLGENGVLGAFQQIGVTLALGVGHNGPVSAGNIDAQMDVLMSWMVDALVVNLIQLVNFGRVVNDVGTCGSAYAAAINSGVTDGPAHAMATCGAPDALIHAQQLDAGTAGFLAGVGFGVFLICVALSYLSLEAMRISWTFVFNFLAGIGAALVAAAPRGPREFAKKRATGIVSHGVESIFIIVGVGVMMIWLAGIAKTGVPGQAWTQHPAAKILVMVVMTMGGVVGAIVLMRKMFNDRGIPGMVVDSWRSTRDRFTHTKESYNKARDGIDDARDRGRDLLDKYRQKRAKAQEDNSDGSSPKLADAPNRKSHPDTGGGGGARRPRSTPAQANAKARESGSSSGSTVGTAAKTAATVAAPEVAAPARTATAVLDRVKPSHRGDDSGSGAGQSHSRHRATERPQPEPPSRTGHQESRGESPRPRVDRPDRDPDPPKGRDSRSGGDQ